IYNDPQMASDRKLSRYLFDCFYGRQHSSLNGVHVEIVEEDPHLGADQLCRLMIDTVDPYGVLHSQRGYCCDAIATHSGDGLYVGQYAGASRWIEPSYSHHHGPRES